MNILCAQLHTTHFEVAKDRQVDLWHGSIKLELMAVIALLLQF